MLASDDPRLEALFEQAAEARGRGDAEAEADALASLHRLGHHLAGVHTRVHVAACGLNWRRGRYGRALLDGLAIFFAAPTSIFWDRGLKRLWRRGGFEG